jgi:predicted DNA-binding transcriptional regulator AlpA
MTRGVESPGHDGMTRAELLALPAVIDITTAARALSLGRSTAYELARRDEFPCRVLRIGSSYRVPTADLLRVLGIDLSDVAAPANPPRPREGS